MKHGKNTHMKHGRKRSVTLTVSVILIIFAVVMGTVAILLDVTDPLENKFTPSNVECSVVDDGAAKKVENTGDIAAYMRVALSSTWQDSAGNVYGETPAASVTADGWILKDGYYYWPDPIDPGKSTGKISAAASGTSPDGDYSFTYEVGAQAIQSVPADAVTESWGVTVTNGKITG